jgi:hypothetical protein
MRMLFAAAVCAATAAAVTPVAAQGFQPPTFTPEEVAAASAAIDELGLDDDTYRDLWCGAAFIFITNFHKSQGDTEAATAAEANGMTLFARVETVLLPQALSTEQLNDIGANASIVAISQMGADGGEPTYTEEECTAAAQAQ